MADESKIASNQESPVAKKSKFAPLLIVVVILSLLGGAGAAWFFLHQGKTAQAAPEPQKVPEYVAHLDPFTVNLADSEDSHFLRITIDLDLGHVPKGADSEKGNGDFPTARVRDAVLAVLTLGKADVLITPDGKAALKHDLIEGLQQKVPEIDVRDVYFTEFLVQR
jgi:flagellar protein FliL